MEKLKFFKGLFFGLIMSAFMWGGIFYTIFKIDEINFQSEVSEVKDPMAGIFSLAILHR